MNKSKQFVAAALATALATAQHVTAQEQAPERHAMLTLLDKFDAFDSSKLQFVRVDTLANNWVQHRFAWVIKRDGKRYQLRYLDLGRGSITTSQQVHVSKVRLTDAITALRANLHRLGNRKSRFMFMPSPTNPMHPRGLALVLARACEQRGMHKEKDTLLGMMGTRQNDLARDLRVRVVMNMADPQISWQRLLQQRRLVIKSFATPRSGLHLGKADEFEKVIAALGDKQTSEAKRLLIKDPWLDGNVMFDSSAMLSPEPKPEGAARPLNALLAEGLAAVPELIKLLDDDTATRSLNWSTKYGGVYSHNTVADQAQAALKLIAGHAPDGTRLAQTRKAAWQKWLDAANDTTLRKLAEGRLEYLRRDAVTYYLARWPDGITHVLQLIEDWPHQRPPTEVLHVLLRDQRFQKLQRVHDLATSCFNSPLGSRPRAGLAAEMMNAGVPNALEALRRTWSDYQMTKPKPPQTHYLDGMCTNLRMLMLHGEASDWLAIRSSNEVDETRQRCALVLLSEPDLLVKAGLRDPARSETLVAAQQALVHMLLDTKQLIEERGITTPSGPGQLHGVACADAAAIALFHLQPQAFNYQPLPLPLERHRQLTTLRGLISR